MYDIAIIGAGTAGMTAALYAARAGKNVLLLEGESIGGQISSSPCVENFPGFAKISGAEFSDNLYEQVMALGVDFEFDTITDVLKNTDGFELTGEDARYNAQKLIIASGVKHRMSGICGEEALVGRGISYCAVCDGAFYKGKSVAVLGGGSSALTSALYLSNLCKEVYIIHRRSEFRGERELVEKVKSVSNINLVLNSTVSEFIGCDELNGLKFLNRDDGCESELYINALFVCVGQMPQNEIFKSLVALDENGYIIAGEDCKTSCDSVFAAGDCRTKTVRQLTTAAGDGAVAAVAASK